MPGPGILFKNCMKTHESNRNGECAGGYPDQAK